MKTNYLLWSAISMIILLAACKAQPTEILDLDNPTSHPEHIEQILYMQAVSELFPEGKEFIVFDKTNDFLVTRDESVSSQLDGLREETLINFLAINQTPSAFSGELKLPGKVILTNQVGFWERYYCDDPQFFDLDWWAIREDYPDLTALLGFSKVGFDASIKQALMEIVYYDLLNIACREVTSFFFNLDNIWVITDRNYSYECG